MRVCCGYFVIRGVWFVVVFVLVFFFFFFFFKQKTAYEIYQCDWSSDVCSSDLNRNISSAMNRIRKRIFAAGILSFIIALLAIFLVSNSIVKPVRILTRGAERIGEGKLDTKINLKTGDEFEIGRASCRERV